MAGRDPPPLDIVVWNVHSSDKEVKASDRHESMKNVLNDILQEDKDNLFILCQNNIDGPKHKIMCAKLAGVTQNNNTAIYHYSRDYRLEPLESRSECLTVFDLTAKNGSRKFLLASYYRKQNSDENSDKDCLEILEELKSRSGLNGVIVGGKFKLDATLADQTIKELSSKYQVTMGLLNEYEMPKDTTKDGDECIIYWPEDMFTPCGPIRTPFNDYKRTKGQRPFYHPILMCPFMTNVPVQQVHEDVLAARPTDLDELDDTRRSEFGDGKFRADFHTWTKLHKALLFHNIRKAKQSLYDDGASILFSFWDSEAWSLQPGTVEMSETSAQVILNCLPKREIYRARRMLVIKDTSGVCLEQMDRKDLFLSRGCKSCSLQGYHNSHSTYFTPDVACVSVYGLFPLEATHRCTHLE